MIRYNTKRFWGYSADTKPAYAQIGDRFLELDTKSEYFLGTFNKWELIGNSGGTSTGVSGDYLPLSGGTVYGPTIFTSGVTANTLSSIDYIDFDLLSGASAASSVSRLRYVADEGGLVTTLLGGNIDLQIGQQNVVFCYNGDTENLTKGQVVAIIGNQGNRPKIQRAIASAETTSSTALGVVAETINTGNEGFVTTFGNVRGFELTGITPGSYVYLSPTVLGGFTGTQPQAPDHIVALGYVVRTGETQGEIFVNISNGWELNELHNVKITNPSNYDILQYSAGTFPVWYNTSSPFLSGLTATTISATTYLGLPYSGTSNYVVKWSGSTGLTDSLIYDNGSIVVVSGTTATVSGSKFSVTGPIAAGGVQLSSKNESIAIATSNYASWGTGVKQIAIGEAAPLGSSTGSNNIAIGSASMKNAVTPSGNTAIGTETLNFLETGNYNVAIGYNAAKNLDQTDEAVYIGYQAGLNGGLSTYNVVLGSQAAMSLSGVNNVAVGRLAFGDKTTGNGNVAIGTGAGRASTGGGNVFLGFQAGYYSTGDNKLYIHNSLGDPPLIYGEFDNLRLGIATTAVTNTLHVSATTHPLRLEGLVSSANTRYLVANSDGVVTYTTGATGGGLTYYISGSTPLGVTLSSGDRWFNTESGLELVYVSDGDSSQWIQPNTLAASFTGNTAASCISQLYVTNVYGCSPITFHDQLNMKSGATISGTTVFSGPVSMNSGLTVTSISSTGVTTLGSGTFTKAGFASGDVLLDNGGTDTPGVLMYYANNSNFAIDSYNGTFDVLSGQLFRIVNNLNEAGGAVKVAIDTSGNMSVVGFVKPGAWRAGQVINDIMLSNTEVTISTTTIATSTSDTDFLTYSYTPISSSSYLIIHYHLASYDFTSGTGNDSYFSRIKVDGNEITYGAQNTVNGFRTGVLFPLTGRYTNSNTTAKSIVVACRRNSADDSITIVNSSTSMWLRITEIAR